MLIALDTDGVKLNYRKAYAKRWERTFGYQPVIKDPLAYKLWDYYDIPYLSEEEHAKWIMTSDSEFWLDMPIIESALEACQWLVAAGHDLVAVTACPAEFSKEREHNLRDFPLSGVYCVGTKDYDRRTSLISPKAAIINELKPHYFVDDFIDYFAGCDRTTKRVLINNPVNFVSGIVPMHEIDHVVNDLSEFAVTLLAEAA